jgi:hypothetical protein
MSPQEFEDEEMNYDSKGAGGEKSSPTISAVRLSINLNEIKCCRKITLKGVYGDPNILKTFIS